MSESKEAGQCKADPGDVKLEFEGAEEEEPLEVDTSERVFKNKCVHTRANIENKVYRMFSLVYSHPSQCEEDDWTVLRTQDDTMLVDKRSMAILSMFECQWLTAPATSVVLEPDILAVSCTPK
tara:strand:- start:33 stop:401 length:369 start_codon:yes stop_codon:yes gene_type:complete